MHTGGDRLARRRGARAGGTATAVLTGAIGLAALTACTEDPAGPAAGGQLAEEWRLLEEDLDSLAGRIGALEEPPRDAAGPPVVGDGDPAQGGTGLFEDPAALTGQDVSVRAEVSEVLAVADVGAAFRVAGEDGGIVAVVTAIPPPAALAVDDVVRVSGTVTAVEEETFEADFGIAAATLADDPAALLADIGGTAIAADGVEVLQAPAG